MVLVDTPPDLGFLMITALIAADWFLIPVFPSGYDLRGLEALLHTAAKVRERYNPGLRLLGVLLGNADARANPRPGRLQPDDSWAAVRLVRASSDRMARRRAATAADTVSPQSARRRSAATVGTGGPRVGVVDEK